MAVFSYFKNLVENVILFCCYFFHFNMHYNGKLCFSFDFIFDFSPTLCYYFVLCWCLANARILTFYNLVFFSCFPLMQLFFSPALMVTHGSNKH